MHVRPIVHKPDVPDEFITLAYAYLDSAEELNNLMCKEVWSGSFHRGQVVLYMTFHATELFLKGCILSINPNEHVKRHSLMWLTKKLESLNPEIEFSPPFMEISRINQSLKDNPQAHEELRYPMDNDGNPWPGLAGFDEQTFGPILNRLRTDFTKIRQQAVK